MIDMFCYISPGPHEDGSVRAASLLQERGSSQICAPGDDHHAAQYDEDGNEEDDDDDGDCTGPYVCDETER